MIQVTAQTRVLVMVESIDFRAYAALGIMRS
jgi:hypothetical protein